MGSRKTMDGAEKVYEAAALWVDRALRNDDSLFTPGKPIWTRQRLGELRERFLDRPDEGTGGFYDKLKAQLEGSPPEVYQLMGEALYLQFLVIWHEQMGGATKKNQIEQVLKWGAPISSIPDGVIDGFTVGIAQSQTLTQHRPFHVGLVSEFVEQWKEQEPIKRQRLLEDPWAFKDFLMGIQCRSILLRNNQNTPRAQREALLHLVHPDTFEGTVSIRQKEEFANAKVFDHFVTEQTQDIDRNLVQIRRGLEAELGRNFDFYDPDIGARLARKGLWDRFVEWGQVYVDTGKLEEEEIGYKLVIGERLGLARAAVLGGNDDWADLLRRGLAGNLIFAITQAKLRDWIKKSPENASEALKAIWAAGDIPLAKRIRAFCALLPTAEISGTGTRTTVASVLLMGLDVEQFPPFGTTIFGKAYELAGYNEPEADADEAASYEHALGFLDRFIDEASERGLSLRHRLDAQSVVWTVVRGRDEELLKAGGQESENGEDATVDDASSQYEPDLPALAEEVFLPVEFLREIDTLLKDKKQVIFQGPPGTGKTYVAQKLANCLAGSKDRVTLVQFHPSYAYEDFVQGFRPVQTGNGQAGFELRDGPLRRAAERARNEPNADHFLVIDEINRGNLAKVFGELYFLLEYRDAEISLQYQQKEDHKFSLPTNLYIIGTMNTADRSIALVDLALRRRFYFVEFHPDDEPVRSVLREWLANKAPAMEWVADVVEDVNEKLKDDRHAAIGPSYFMKEDLDRETVERVWRHSVVPYVEECLFGDNDKIGEFNLKKLMGEQPRLDCIVDGLSRLLGIDGEDASSRLEAEGGVTQADISNRWPTWHAAFKTAGLERITIPQAERITLGEIAENEAAFIARVSMHLVTVIDGEAFEACDNRTDMDRKPNHYWIKGDGAERATASVKQNDNA